VDPGNSAIYQFRNTGNARYYGWEADLSWSPFSASKLGLQYTLTKRRNLDHPDIWFTDVPEHKFYSYIRYTFFSSLELFLSGMYNSSRISTSDGLYHADPFFTMDFNMVYTFGRALSLEAAVTNLLDASYGYVEGYPAPGREFMLGFRYSIR
jgi:iron complex outermembrane receptor protein